MIRYDYLASAHPKWPMRAACAVTPKDSCICLLDLTFGNAAKPFKRYVAAGFKYFLVHFWWADSHMIAPLSLVRRLSSKWERLAKAHEGVTIYISHSLEHEDTNVPAVYRRMDLMTKLAPSCIPVNCINYRKGKGWVGAIMPDDFNEAHIGEPGKVVRLQRPFMVSTDGVSILDIDAKKYIRDHKNAHMIGAWAPRYNLRTESGPQKPPKKRTAAPDKKYLQKIVKLMSCDCNA